MYVRSPSEQAMKVALAVDPARLQETVDKVDECVRRLQELQYAAASSLSPRCKKREPLRNRNAHSPGAPGKLPANAEAWRKLSLPAMILRETVGEITQASQFARDLAESASSNMTKSTEDIPSTPQTERHTKKQNPEHTDLHQRRKSEKEVVLQRLRSESDPLLAQRVKSRINFTTSPLQMKDFDKENCRFLANKVSPRNKPWTKKAVLFPNPLFHSSPTPMNENLDRSTSLAVAENVQNLHQLLMTSLPFASKNLEKVKCRHTSPRQGASFFSNMSPGGLRRLKRSLLPSRLANRLVSPQKDSNSVRKKNDRPSSATPKPHKLYSPSTRAKRLMLPLQTRNLDQNNERISLHIQRRTSLSVQSSSWKI